jgi:heme exporter protein A
MLQATGLSCARSGRTLFRGLSFALGAGTLLRIAGPNGSGKTSLLRILCGLLTPDAGEVRWNGGLIYLGHAAAVNDELSAAENLAVACDLAGLARHGIGAALERFGVPGGLVRRLSQGQRRRAALARLVLSESVPLWLLDEPLTALDAAAADLTKELIQNHVASGGAVAYTTHQDAGLRDSRVIEL